MCSSSRKVGLSKGLSCQQLSIKEFLPKIKMKVANIMTKQFEKFSHCPPLFGGTVPLSCRRFHVFELLVFWLVCISNQQLFSVIVQTGIKSCLGMAKKICPICHASTYVLGYSYLQLGKFLFTCAYRFMTH